jgi:CspA family cold shock protein
MKGTVKWFNDRKGFGFIICEDEKEIFVHRNALVLDVTLAEGDQVEYEIEETDRGPQAKNVKKFT